MNQIAIKGRLTRDPELTITPSNVPVAKFAVAVDREFQKKDAEKQVDFFDVVAWRGTAEFLAKYFFKGQEILLRGEMQSRHYTDKQDNKRTAWEVVADKVFFCGSKSDRGGNSQPYAPTDDGRDDDELPF